MASIRTEYKNIIQSGIDNSNSHLNKLVIIMFFFILYLLGKFTLLINGYIRTLEDVALVMSAVALFITFGLRENENVREKRGYLIEDGIRQRQEQLVNIEDSIYRFYLPLHGLLSTHNENIKNKAKLRKMAEINGHKHLAEPRIRCVFEKYMQANESNHGESRKLLELVNRDIETLQNRYIELKSDLKRE